jgi:ubiquinone/menaquinone biosynthesis C-methylase UbiE
MRNKVEAGYDHMAEQYLATKKSDDIVTLAALEELARGLPDGATALDLGCGAGVPVMQWLARRFEVTGVDVSARQLELARPYVPTARLIKSDMISLDFPAASFDIVVAFFSIIHVPREEQPALVSRIYNWLKPGGRFLAPWAVGEWEGEEENWEEWGATMWWSHYDAEANLAMLQNAGFLIQSAERRTSNDETWLWILAHKQPV